MSLIVETGEGIVDADSYFELATINAYASQFGYTNWLIGESGDAELIAKQEISCRHGTLYIDLRYNSKLKGTKLIESQGLEWPRMNARLYNGMIIEDGYIHPNIVKAAMEAAIYHYQGIQLLHDIAGGAILTSKSIANGAISKTWDKDSYDRLPVFRKIDNLLYPLFGNTTPTPSSSSNNTLNAVTIARGV